MTGKLREACLTTMALLIILFLGVFGGRADAEINYGEQLEALYQGHGENDSLRAKIMDLLERKLAIPDAEHSLYGTNRMWEISLPHMPPWVDRQVLVAYRGAVYLVGIGQAAARIEILAGTTTEVYVNLAKFEAFYDGNKITLWSQRPFTAAELVAELAWNGTGLLVLSARYGDPTAEYYDKMAVLLQTGRLPEAMAAEKAVFYPGSYEGYYKIPQLAILQAHAYALEKYRTGDPATAVKVLKWGLDQYLTVHAFGPLSPDNLHCLKRLTEPGSSFAQPFRIDLQVFLGILNDYAFFLAEIGRTDEAERYLKKVVEMAPERLVAYINLGDVCWELGKYQEAASYYRRYLELLGDAQTAPPRVWDRARSL